MLSHISSSSWGSYLPIGVTLVTELLFFFAFFCLAVVIFVDLAVATAAINPGRPPAPGGEVEGPGAQQVMHQQPGDQDYWQPRCLKAASVRS